MASEYVTLGVLFKVAGTRAKPDYFYCHGLFTEIVKGKPVQVDGQFLPSIFRAIYYVIDNQGRKLFPDDNWRQIPTWTIELFLKVNESGYIEPLQCFAKGAHNYLNSQGKLTHSRRFGEAIEIPLDEFQPLSARHFAQMNKYRASLIADATANVLISYEYIGDGKHHRWQSGNKAREISDEVVLNLRDNTQKRSYTKVGDTFLQDVARKYLAILETGDPNPTKTLHETYYKHLVGYDRLSAYLTKCRKMNLIPEIPKKHQPPTTKKGKK